MSFLKRKFSLKATISYRRYDTALTILLIIFGQSFRGDVFTFKLDRQRIKFLRRQLRMGNIKPIPYFRDGAENIKWFLRINTAIFILDQKIRKSGYFNPQFQLFKKLIFE